MLSNCNLLLSALKCSDGKAIEPNMKRSRDFAHFNDNQGITYICKKGYSFTAADVNDKTRTVHCQANGSLGQRTPQYCIGIFQRHVPV